jgi:hypothetical protein
VRWEAVEEHKIGKVVLVPIACVKGPNDLDGLLKGLRDDRRLGER